MASGKVSWDALLASRCEWRCVWGGTGWMASGKVSCDALLASLSEWWCVWGGQVGW